MNITMGRNDTRYVRSNAITDAGDVCNREGDDSQKNPTNNYTHAQTCNGNTVV